MIVFPSTVQQRVLIILASAQPIHILDAGN